MPDIVIQRILRHANVSTTATYYIKTAADDVRNAMAKLEGVISTAFNPEQQDARASQKASLETTHFDSIAVPSTVNLSQ